MKIIKSLIKCNFEPRTNRKIEYIVIHYTAGLSSEKGSALGCAKNTFGNPATGASAHYIVDDFDIVQAVEDKDKAWHCGTKKGYKHKYCRNENSIGIEISSNYKGGIPKGKTYKDLNSADSNWYLTDSAKELAAQLTAELCVKYNLHPNEAVLRHYDITGKDCPSPFVDDNKEGFLGWLKFKTMVLRYYNDILNIDNESDNIEKVGDKVVYHKLDNVPEWAKSIVKWYLDEGYMSGKGDDILDISEDMLRMMVILYRVITDKE